MKKKVSWFLDKILMVSACFCCLSLSDVKGVPLLRNYDIWGDKEVNNSAYNSDSSEYNSESTAYNSTSREKDAGLRTNRTSKVLNFFPVPVEDECSALDGRRKGLCMNTYECRIQGGASSGHCALGFGVCCIFTATCGYEVINNITYFVNPDFPDLSRDMTTCELIVKKIDPEIAQLRLDFIHFNLGQPNRRTGVCDDDFFLMSGGNSRDVKMCGLNSGQHVYYDVENTNEPITIKMNLSKFSVARMWEVRVLQVPFTERAPAGCTQYHTGERGIIQTMNFADNGRRLADQDYNICMRQEVGMCSIAYEPCHDNAFRIGSGPRNLTTIPRPPDGIGGDEEGAASDTQESVVGADGAQGGPGGEGGPAEGDPEAAGEDPPGEGAGDGTGDGTGDGAGEDAGEDAGDGTGDGTQDDTGDGTGEDAGDDGTSDGDADDPEAVQDDTMDDVGSGDGEAARTLPIYNGEFRETCSDRIVMPCDSDELITLDGNAESLGFCDIAHCGSSLCPPGEKPCRIESNITPFTVGVHFGPSAREESPDDNLGMCLRYEQLPCTE